MLFRMALCCACILSGAFGAAFGQEAVKPKLGAVPDEKPGFVAVFIDPQDKSTRVLEPGRWYRMAAGQELNFQVLRALDYAPLHKVFSGADPAEISVRYVFDGVGTKWHRYHRFRGSEVHRFFTPPAGKFKFTVEIVVDSKGEGYNWIESKPVFISTLP